MLRPSLLAIARHGESLRNHLYRKHKASIFMPEEAAEELRDIANHAVPLTQVGKEHARAMVKKLARFGPFDAIYHSGYTRAHETAMHAWLAMGAMGEKSPMPVADIRFRERDAGPAFGMTTKEAAKHFPWLADYWKREGWFYARPPFGESLADLYEGRVRQALADLFSRHNNQRVLVVCHGRVQQVARLLLDELPINHLESPFSALPNCAAVVWNYEKFGLNTLGEIVTLD